MITLYCYPPLFGVADNNRYGLKVYAFLKLGILRSRTRICSTPRRRRAASSPILSTMARRSATATRSSRT